eukprot:4911315-Prymnesium_polylepis.1
MLPSLSDVSDALDEYHEYRKKQGRFASPLLWIRATKVSPADVWLEEAPKVKWLNKIGSQLLSLTHSASGTERNWSSHSFIFADRRQSQKPVMLERNVRMCCNMRLRDSALARGVRARKQAEDEPKGYPLQEGDWSSCDESSEDDSEEAIMATMSF